MLEIAAVKRKAKYAGEIGLFPASQDDDEEIKSLGDDMVWAQITTPRSLKQMRFLFALFTKLADGGLFDDKEDAKRELLTAAKFTEDVVRNGEIVREPRSLSGVRSDLLSRLINRIVYIVCANLLPHIKEADLRREIEEMVT